MAAYMAARPGPQEFKRVSSIRRPGWLTAANVCMVLLSVLQPPQWRPAALRFFTAVVRDVMAGRGRVARSVKMHLERTAAATPTHADFRRRLGASVPLTDLGS